MTEDEAIKLAVVYLQDKAVEFVLPGTIGEVTDGKLEVIFLVPDALDPDVVIDPPDVRVWVDSVTHEVSLIEQM